MLRRRPLTTVLMALAGSLFATGCVEDVATDDWLLPADWKAVEILGGTVAMPAELTRGETAAGCTSFSLDPDVDLCDPSTWAETSIGLTVLEAPPTAILPRTARWQPYVAADVEPDDLGRGAAVAGFSLPARYTRPPQSVTDAVFDTTSESSGAPLRELRARNGDTLAIVGICDLETDTGFCRGVRDLLDDGVEVGACRHHEPSTNIDCVLSDDVGIRIFQGLVHAVEIGDVLDSIDR